VTAQHTQLAEGRWFQMSFFDQMANIGSEVERALNWKTKNNTAYTQKAFVRALELIDLTLEDRKNHRRLRELARVREAIVDYFSGNNDFNSTEASWKNYFLNFAYAARRHY